MSYYDDEPDVEIGVGSAYANAWRQVWSHFLILFIVGIVFWAAESMANAQMFNWSYDDDYSPLDIFKVIFGVQSALVSTALTIFLVNPLGYGRSYVYLKAARNEPVDIKDMFEPFKDYLNVVFASFLAGAIIAIGFVFLIIPGIIFACKLAFTPYLVVEKKMKAIDALAESWEMTNGYAFHVFLIGLLAGPVFILGLMCFGVGVIPALMIIKLAYASLYHAVESADYVRFPEDDPLYD
jgi:uncharacterized membrane protein